MWPLVFFDIVYFIKKQGNILSFNYFFNEDKFSLPN